MYIFRQQSLIHISLKKGFWLSFIVAYDEEFFFCGGGGLGICRDSWFRDLSDNLLAMFKDLGCAV